MILLAKIALGITGVAVAGAGALCSEGLVHVRVIEKQPGGAHINVIAPAIIAPIAMHFAPRRHLAEATRHIQPYMPVACAALEGLRDADDVVLVEVKGPGEHVRVAKWGGSIVVDVDDADDTLHISAPIRAVMSTVEQLAAVDSDQFERRGTTTIYTLSR